MDCLVRAKSVLADKAYDADECVRDKREEKGCEPVILSKINRLKSISYDRDIYKNRHLLEINHLAADKFASY